MRVKEFQFVFYTSDAKSIKQILKQIQTRLSNRSVAKKSNAANLQRVILNTFTLSEDKSLDQVSIHVIQLLNHVVIH